MAQTKDYYEVLGVSETATQDEIKSRYRALARVYHSDKSGDEGAHQFKEISEAYEVLYDPVKRKAYDMLLNEAPTDDVQSCIEPLVDRYLSEFHI